MDLLKFVSICLPILILLILISWLDASC